MSVSFERGTVYNVFLGVLDFGDSHFAQVEHVFHIWAFFEMRAKEKVRELKIAVCLVTRNEHLRWKYAYFSK